MKCPNIKVAGQTYCISEGRTYMPNAERLNGYCNSMTHEDCTLYKEILDKVRLFTYCG